EATTTLVVASWNVENLFDTEDDPNNEGDDAYTPNGWVRWTPARYRLKLQHLAEVIAHMKPDVLCMTEIENRRVLEDLSGVLLSRHAYALPVIVHRDSPDKRGIDVAVLARHVPVATNWLATTGGQREVLACEFNVGGRSLTVLVNHWKSQLGKKAESDDIRRREALAVRAYLDARLERDPAAAMLVAGDFNDAPESPILVDAAGLVPDEARVRADTSGRLLFNLSASLPEEKRATYYYAAGKKWNVMDSISATRGMLEGVEPAAPWGVAKNGYSVVKTPAQHDADGIPIPFRFVRSKTKGNAFKTGYSDHFPVRVKLKAR
ncbi:MAG TPA: endonuclease/exonuclease/phosphatase family protein, partial [Kiritimatiellia bacterium]|nr:endonuclease/exonuclease/phosphatase family protein [Kiritimatiellia bacterium]HRU70850.1 endonuclease/exonuclease/phosphatase family protein [Kiritimatiellia bacterium]